MCNVIISQYKVVVRFAVRGEIKNTGAEEESFSHKKDNSIQDMFNLLSWQANDEMGLHKKIGFLEIGEKAGKILGIMPLLLVGD